MTELYYNLLSSRPVTHDYLSISILQRERQHRWDKKLLAM